MQAVEQHPYTEQVVASLPGDSVVGAALGDDPVLDFLDSEIMKIGSLAHAGIDWPKVESESLRLLSDRSKDLKVFGFLMLCLQRGGNGERFSLSLYLLHKVLNSWWTDAWPFPGNRGKRPRTMLFNQMVQRAEQAVAGLSFDAGVGDGRAYCLELVEQLLVVADAAGLPIKGLTDLRRSIASLSAASGDGEAAPPSTDKVSAEPVASTLSATTTSSASLGALALDAGNERATRQNLLKVAGLLTESSPDEPLGYQLRRYAIWYNITTVPPARDGTKTDLAAVSADRVADYRDALAKQPDYDLWQRIEQSLSVSPFWLEGHWYSAQMAQNLGLPKCADAIRLCLQGFVERLPALVDLTFSDGTPFVPKTVVDWLASTPDKRSEAGSGEHWDQAYETACKQLEREGLAVAMQGLEDGLAAAEEPRARFYWRLMSANLLQQSGLTTLAQQQIQDLHEQTGDISLEQWEPGLMARLERQS